jgi:hypothetical protein
MKLTDLCDDILFKIEDEIKIIKDNKKYKSSYDNFVKKFKYQIKFYKYDTLCDELHPDHPDDVMRTKDLMVKNMDDIEITNFKYWPPLDELGGEGFNDLNCFDIDDQHI